MTLWKNVFAFISCRRKWENFPKNDLCCLLNFRLSLGSHLRDRRGNWIYNSTRFLIAFQIQLDCLFATLFFRNLNWNFLSFSQKPVKLFFSLSSIWFWFGAVWEKCSISDWKFCGSGNKQLSYVPSFSLLLALLAAMARGKHFLYLSYPKAIKGKDFCFFMLPIVNIYMFGFVFTLLLGANFLPFIFTP